MLVITMETGSLPGGRTRWAGRRHDDDRPDASSGTSSAELFDAVFHALHDGEQVALGFDCALTMAVPPDSGRASAPADADALVMLAEPVREVTGMVSAQSRPSATCSPSCSAWKTASNSSDGETPELASSRSSS